VANCYDCIHYGEECTVIDDPYAPCPYYKSISEEYKMEIKEVHDAVLLGEELDQYIDQQIEYLLLNRN